MIPDLGFQAMRAIIVGSLVLPVLPLALAWWRDRRETARRPGPRVVLVVVTLSQAWLLSTFVHPETIGRHYTDMRWVLILANLGAMLASAVGAVTLRGPLWGLLALTSLWLVGSWLYVLVVSSAV